MLQILTYHHIRADGPDRATRRVIQTARFAEHMAVLAGTGAVVSLAAGLEGARGVAITVDDGYENFFSDAFPLLSRFSLSATLFVSTAKIGKVIYEADQAEEVRYADMAQLRELQRSGLISVEGHGHSHKPLATLARSEVQSDIRRCAEGMAFIRGTPSKHFCYPYGSYNETVIEQAQAAGFESGCTTDAGTNSGPLDAMRLRRDGVSSSTTADDLFKIVSGAHLG